MIHNIEEYLPYWQKRAKRHKSISKKWRIEAYREANRIANILRRKYSVRAVYLIGSIAREDVYFYKKPDIDLVVLGLKHKDFFKASSFVESKSNYHIDLIQLEDANNRLKDTLRHEGVILYGRPYRR